MKRIVSLMAVFIFVLSSMGAVFAKENESVKINDQLLPLIETDMATQSFSNNRKVYTEKITDKNELKKLQKEGEGKLVSRTITYILPEENQEIPETLEAPRWGATYTVGSWTYDGNRWWDKIEGTPYRIQGAADFTLKAKTSTTYSMYGEGSGKVKGLVEIKLGGSIGHVEENEWDIDVKIDEDHYRDIEVWEYETKYTFKVLKDDETYKTGCSAFKPNGGVRIVNDLHEKPKDNN